MINSDACIPCGNNVYYFKKAALFVSEILYFYSALYSFCYVMRYIADVNAREVWK